MWSALLTALPFILRIANMILDKNGANEQEKKDVLNLIVKGKDDALTPIKIKDDMAALRAKLKARMQAKKNVPPNAEAN